MAAAAWAGPVEGDGCETTTEAEPTNLESVEGQTEDEQPTTEVPPNSEQHPVDGKSKPASEKIWGSFLKNSGLGKVMGGRKKKEQAAGVVDGSGEGVEQEKSPTHSQPTQGEGTSPPSSPKQGSGQLPNSGGARSQEQCIEMEPEGEEATQEQKLSSKDAKPKQGEKSSVRDLIRKPVARIFSHRNTEKKDCGAEAPKHGKTRSKSLDRLEDPEVCPSALDQTDNSQAGGEPHKSAPHSARHMKRWHSFKKLMAQKSLKKSTEDPKDVDGAEGPSSNTQLEPETLESAAKLDHTGQKRWKLKRSWTFQGLKRDPSVIGIHKPKGSDKDLSDNLKGEETLRDVDQGDQGAISSEESKPLGEGETQEKSGAEREEEKGPATQRAKSVDHHANEIWTSFKKRVIPKSKRSVDTGGGGGEEDQAGEHEQAEEQAGREHGKSAKSKRTHFNRAVSLKNFIMRKGKSTSVDMGEGLAGQKEEGGESTGDAPADVASPAAEDIKESDSPTDQTGVSGLDAPAVVQNGGDDRAEAAGTNGQPNVSASASQEPEITHPDAKEETQAEPASGATCPEMKAHGENGSSSTGCDRKGSGTSRENEKIEDIMAQDHEIPQEDAPQEKVKQEDPQEAVHQTENDCSDGLKDETSLNQEQCSERKCCSGNPVAQSGECITENDCYDPPKTGGDIVVLDTSFELEPTVNGPPQNGGDHSGSVETETEPNYQEEDQKRMFYEAAASIVQTVVSAAAEQLAKEKDLLDNGFKGSYHNNNDNYTDLDVNYCH